MPCSQAGNTWWSGSVPPTAWARRYNIKMASMASSLSGITRSPASVLLRPTVRSRSSRFTSRQCSPLNSQPRIVVLRAMMAAQRATCQSGLLAAARRRRSFSSGARARPTLRRMGSGLTSSATRYHRLARFRTPRRAQSSRLIVVLERRAALRRAM